MAAVSDAAQYGFQIVILISVEGALLTEPSKILRSPVVRLFNSLAVRSSNTLKSCRF